MSASTAVEAGRRLAESLMLDTFVVETEVGRGELNPQTGKRDRIYREKFQTPGRLRDMGYADADQQVGGRREATGATQAQVPFDIADVKLNDRIRVLDIGPDTAPRHLGKTYYISTDHDRSMATMTRLVVKEDPWPSP